ncbi:transposase zinc-binding domain-containing protein [Klebsiella pneumoniae]|nr:transposase zinc-binding domain-containing protein [Klebsiella pneumoniae]
MPRLATSRRQAAGCAPLPSAHTGSRYARHAPERTLLYALVEAHYPDFIARIEAEGRSLPGYVREAFDAYLRCGVLEHGFLRVVCEHTAVQRGWWPSARSAGLCPSCARRMAESAALVEEVFACGSGGKWGAERLVPLAFSCSPASQKPLARCWASCARDRRLVGRSGRHRPRQRPVRCGDPDPALRRALNLNIHLHMLWLDGVYEDTTERPQRKPRLHRTRAPTSAQLTELGQHHRASRVPAPSRRGWLEGEDESVFLSDEVRVATTFPHGWVAMSFRMTYRIATGRDAGCKVVTLQTFRSVTASSLRATPAMAAFAACRRGRGSTRCFAKLGAVLATSRAPGDQGEQRLSISPQGSAR